MKHFFCVAGSINIDLCVTLERFPLVGETVTGKSFSTSFGGKGANQAVALAKLLDRGQKRVLMAGKIGRDAYGVSYKKWLSECGIDISLVSDSDLPTGTALIEIDDSGANRIVVVPGANGDTIVTNDFPAFPPSDQTIFLFQLEIPLETVCSGIIAAHASHGLVILDPAPAQALPERLLASTDFITPNEGETLILTGIRPDDDSGALRAAEFLLKKGVGGVIIKAGGNGSWFFSKNERWHCPAFPVEVRDTTAAGDSFNAGFAFAIGNDSGIPDALRFANAVGALSTTLPGAQSAMPDLDSARALLRAWPKISPRRL